MKKLILSFVVLTSVLATSCKKESEVKPEGTPASPRTVSVEYRISSVSGHVNVDYTGVDATGNLADLHAEVSRNEESFKFSYQSGHSFSISAQNVTPSHSVVQVQVYLDGVLKVENSSTDPSHPAVAQGSF
ncbi:MAG: hypothetical protein ACJ77K_01035 [Bacteroidia bacterium]